VRHARPVTLLSEPASELRQDAAAAAHKERVADGRWIWTLDRSGDKLEVELEESALPGPAKVQTL
jgi:hypothetical protein